MTLAAEKEFEHIGETCGCKDHDHDLIHDLSKRLDALWRYDQYIANAEGKQACKTCGVTSNARRPTTSSASSR